VRAEEGTLGGWRRRERNLMVVVVGIFALVILRLFHLQVLQGARYRELSEENRIRVDVLTAPRGEIRDRNGRLLADSVPSFTVTLDPWNKTYTRSTAKLDSTLTVLGPILGFDPALLRDKVHRERKQSFLPIRLKRNVDMASVAFVSEHRDQLPGVEVESEPLRRYPFGASGSHLLGYVGEISEKELQNSDTADYLTGDLIGRMGIERRYEGMLRGLNGKRFVEVNALGRKAELLGEKHPILPRRGQDLTLTIDWNLQRAAEDAFEPGARGAVVVMDPRNGEVLALVSKPNYDPNEFSNGISQDRWNELSSGGNYPLFNRAIQAAYPPGSTLKPFNALAALAYKAITVNTMFQTCTGEYRFGSRLFGCWKHEGHGGLAMRGAITQSCDVYFYQLGLRLGLTRLAEFMARLRLSERTGIDLPQERRGLFPDESWYDKHFGPGRWSRGVTLNLSIGQGEIMLTPVKLAQLTAFVANGGTLWTPHLVKSVASEKGSVARTIQPDSLARIVDVSSSDIRAVQEAMVSVVEDPQGTGGQARVDSILVAGKTGTAQNLHGKDHALFICFAPAAAPRIAIAVMVENAGHGSTAAAPIARKVLEMYFHPAAAESAAALARR